MKQVKGIGLVREYGNEYTHLTLTRRADYVYGNVEPMHIYEFVDDDDAPEYRYFVRGCADADDLSESDLNDYLEDLGLAWQL